MSQQNGNSGAPYQASRTLQARQVEERPPAHPVGQDDDRPPSRQAVLVAVASGLGYMFDAYVVNIYSFVLPLIAVTFALSTTAQGVVGSIMLLGYAIGTFGFGWAADRFGRKDTLGVSILVYGITTAASGLAPGTGLFAALRLLTGVGGAGELSVGVPYTAEIWPRRTRATGAGGVIFSLYAVGALLALLASLVLAPGYGWRATFVFALVPAIGVFWLRRKLTESLPFLRARERAASSAARLGTTRRRDRIREILADRRLRKHLLVASLIFIGNAVGYWGFLVFLQKYMIGEFKLSFRHSLALTTIFYAAMVAWPFLGARTADRIGRRGAGILGAVIVAAGSLVAFSTHSLAIFVIAQVFGIGALGWTWSVGETYVAELFPTRLRATGFGLGVSIGRIPAIAGPLVTGAMASQIGIGNVARWFALIWVFLIVGYLIGPETKGKSLAELDAVDPAELSGSTERVTLDPLAPIHPE
ncbi:MAG TPA: MFS transporter [Streptosporangiaceae bacterium]|jgi:putative MFS transporter|nr:MFS transporter [Streptosporangiaceae bacterium]